MTRKLRRRPNDPVPVPDKRRKPLTTNIVLLLDDRDIDSDLRQISRARPVSANQSRKQNVASHSPSPQTVDTGIYKYKICIFGFFEKFIKTLSNC